VPVPLQLSVSLTELKQVGGHSTVRVQIAVEWNGEMVARMDKGATAKFRRGPEGPDVATEEAIEAAVEGALADLPKLATKLAAR
jgi:hypothetical protein